MLRQNGGLGIKDAIDLLFEPVGLGVGLGIVRAIDIFDVFLEILQGMKDAQMMESLREDLGDHRAVVLAQVGDDHSGVVAFGA